MSDVTISRLSHVTRALFRIAKHTKAIAIQHRREIDGLRARLDELQGQDTSHERKLIALADVDAPRADRRSTLPEHTGSADARSRLRGLYRGSFKDGAAARSGDLWTFAGSLWHCDRDTTERPSRRPDCWTLCVKRGKATKLEDE